MTAYTNQLNPAFPLHNHHMLIANAIKHLTNAYSSTANTTTYDVKDGDTHAH